MRIATTHKEITVTRSSTMNRQSFALLAATAAAAIAVTAAARQGAAPAPDAKPAAPAARPNPADLGPKMIQMLKATPGCMGVESGKLDSGKLVIFAFFKDKKAAMEWYHHPMHQQLQNMAAPDRDKNRTPMASVPDGVPVVAVASLTPSEKPVVDGGKLPFSQIAIELYTPLTGGLNIGGGFAPDDFRALPKITSQPK
jgi:hypothetical protein